MSKKIEYYIKEIEEKIEFPGKEMKYKESNSEFDNIYNEIFSQCSEECENHRNKIFENRKEIFWIRLALIGIGVILILIMLFLGLLDGRESIFSILFFIDIVAYIIFEFIYVNCSRADTIENYLAYYKNNVISKLVKLINRNLVYEENVDSQIIELYEKVFGNTNCQWYDDYIHGTICGNKYIEMINFLNSKSDDFDQDDILFGGIFVTVNLGKNINTSIKILPDKAIMSTKRKLNLDSSKFEEYFDVHTDDKILATRILTADVMEKLVNIYKKYNIGFDISLINNKLYLRLFSEETFEPTLYNKYEKDRLYYDYNCINIILELSKLITEVIDNMEI